MNHFLAMPWWMLAIRGTAAVLFGLLALAWPALTLLVLVLLFAVYTLAVGVVAVIASLRTRDEQSWWLVLLLGLASITTGIVALLYPSMTAFVLVLVIGAGALITGMIDTWIAVRLRRELRNEWLLGAAGVISILVGAFVLLSPGAGALALVWVIALQSIATGVLFVIIGMRVRLSASSKGSPHPRHTERPTLSAPETPLPHLEKLLDEALADSFPASDPLSSLKADDLPARETSGS